MDEIEIAPELPEIARELRRVVLRGGRKLRRLRDDLVSAGQAEILQLLISMPDSTLGCLADEMGISSASMSQAVEKLVKEGLVGRTIGEGDHRKTVVNVTILGRQVATDVLMRQNSWLVEKLTLLPIAELEEVNFALPALASIFQPLPKVTAESKASGTRDGAKGRRAG